MASSLDGGGTRERRGMVRPKTATPHQSSSTLAEVRAAPALLHCSKWWASTLPLESDALLPPAYRSRQRISAGSLYSTEISVYSTNAKPLNDEWIYQGSNYLEESANIGLCGRRR